MNSSGSLIDGMVSKSSMSAISSLQQSQDKLIDQLSSLLVDNLPRESIDERSITSNETERPNRALSETEPEILYEEYDDQEDERDERDEQGIARGEQAWRSVDQPRRVLSLMERWQQLQKTATPAVVTGARSTIMGRKGRKSTPRSSDTAGDDVVETINVRDEMIKDMQQEIQLEQYNVKRRAEVEGEEQGNREMQLQETRGILSLHWTACAKNARILEETENWARYMTCDGLPNPGSLPDMNTFLFLWTMEYEKASVVAMAEKCRMITSLLTKLDGIVRFSTTISAGYASECESIAKQLRYKLQRWIDDACYRLLRDIETNMTRMDPKTATYVSTANEAVCCVWAPIPLPIAAKRHTEKERKPIEVEFHELELTIKMPVDVDCYRMAIRGLWLTYDHYSVETGSYRMPELPNHLTLLWDPSMDLLRFSRKEFREKISIWEEQVEERLLRVEEKKAILDRIEHPPALPGSVDRKGRRRRRPKRPQSATKGKQQQFQANLLSILPTDTQLLPYLPTANEIIRQREDENRKEARRLLFTRCEKTEVNLRKYRILGGVFHVDLVYQPPQPKDLGGETWLTTLELPKETIFVPFARPYEPPQPAADSERTPEVIEAEIKALEAAMEALALITVKLPDTVYWFEPPLVAHWIPEKNIWSTKDVHDIKYNEEQQTIAFRSGRLGVHGLAAYKFANLPFQSWELKPETGRSGRDYGGVVLSVTAATVQAEFIVRDDRVCLNSLVGGASKPLKHILGDYTELETLIEVGCDLFPEADAVSYLKGLAIKHPIAVKQLRECMALLSTAYTFAWSRWNATRDYREIVLQLKEVHGCVAKEGTNLTLLVTPSRTTHIRCTEISPEFSHLPPDENDAKFYADLYQLAMDTAGIKTRLLIKRIPSTVMSTVARLLDRTNVIEMSS